MLKAKLGGWKEDASFAVWGQELLQRSADSVATSQAQRGVGSLVVVAR